MARAKVMTAIVAMLSLGIMLVTVGSYDLMVADHTVEIKSFKFVLNTLIVQSGDTVTWTNRDVAPDIVTAKDKSWSTGRLKKDKVTNCS